MTGNIGIPLAASDHALGVPAADGVSATPLAVLGFFLAWHGYLVYSGRVTVQPFRGRGLLYRPDLDLAALWCGAGLMLWGVGWVVSIPPVLAVYIMGQVVAWTGAALFLFGIVSYVYLPKRFRPAWARPDAPAANAEPPADQPVTAPPQPADSDQP